MELSRTTALERLRTLLEEEAEFLKAGRAHEVVALSEEKLELLRVFEADTTPLRNQNQFRQQVQEIVLIAKQNAHHFKAVSNGLGKLIERMAALRGDTRVGVYSDAGSDMSFQRSHGGYLKKL